MTKTTLLAAASLVAMAFAGSASAGAISATINSQNVPNVAGVVTPYNIATEFTDPTVAAPDNSAAGDFTIANTLTNSITVAGGSVQNYLVTFDITGGTIPTAAAAALNVLGTANGGSFTVAQGARTANSISYVVTVTGVGPTGYVITGFNVVTAARSTSETSIAASGSVALLAGGVTTVVDTAPSVTLVRYAARLGAFSVSAKTAVAALPDFKLFAAGGTAALSDASGANFRTATLAEDFTVAATGTFYKGLTGAAVTRNDIINGGTVTISGPNISAALAPTLVGVTPSSTTFAGNSVTYVLDAAAAQAFAAGTVDFSLSENATAADRVALSGGSYSTSWAPVYSTGYTAPSAATVASGSVSLAGTNFIAPWFSGSQAQTQSVVRMSGNGTQSGAVTLRLQNGVFNFNGAPTTFATATCATTFNIPAAGDLVINTATVKACFGDFLRGDLLITIQSASDGLTGKMRNTSASGTFETTLGRFSGSTAAGATQ